MVTGRLADTQTMLLETSRAHLCLKARPTPAQLADRLRPVDGTFPDGLELYLDVADLRDDTAMDDVVRRVEDYSLPPSFALLIEGPVGSLDGAFFDIARDAEADEAVVRRLAGLARRVGARAVNIHVIAPSDDLACLTVDWHDEALRRAVPFLRTFVEVTSAAGAVPTVEHVPPVLRMRQGGYFFSPIGMAAPDLLWLVDAVPGLAILGDTSHAGLYLAARAAADGRRAPDPEARGAAWLEPLLAFIRQLPPEPDTVLEYLRRFTPHLVNAQVSDAAGLLGEGLPYGSGEAELDAVIGWMGRGVVQHLVTETLEANNDDAVAMRDALRRMRQVLA